MLIADMLGEAPDAWLMPCCGELLGASAVGQGAGDLVSLECLRWRFFIYGMPPRLDISPREACLSISIDADDYHRSTYFLPLCLRRFTALPPTPVAANALQPGDAVYFYAVTRWGRSLGLIEAGVSARR